MKVVMYVSLNNERGDSMQIEAPVHIPKVGDFIKYRYYEYEIASIAHEYDIVDGNYIIEHSIYVRCKEF